MSRPPRAIPDLPSRTAQPASRRQFLQVLGVASAVPFLGALPAAGETPAQSTLAPPAAAPDSEDAAAAADAKSLGEIIQRRYGARLTEAQLYAIRQDIVGGVAAGRVLRAASLQNADAPVTIFRALAPEA